MILSIGNKFLSPFNSRRGVTFLELMVTIVILSTGIVAVYKGLIASLDYQTQLSARLFAMNLMDHEIAVLEKKYETSGEFPNAENGKIVEATLDFHHIPFQFTIQSAPYMNLDGLMQTEIALHWPDHGREITIKRYAYLYSPKIKPTENASDQQ